MFSKTELIESFERLFWGMRLSGFLIDAYRDKFNEFLYEKHIDASDTAKARIAIYNAQHELVRWVVSNLLTDDSVNYINDSMSTVPILESAVDDSISSVKFGTDMYVDFYANEMSLKPNVPYGNSIFPMVANQSVCLIGRILYDSGDLPSGEFGYSRYVTTWLGSDLKFYFTVDFEYAHTVNHAYLSCPYDMVVRVPLSKNDLEDLDVVVSFGALLGFVPDFISNVLSNIVAGFDNM